MLVSPIFLICTERSGSNLIRALMDAHSQVYAPIPIHLGLHYWRNIHHYGDLNKDENWFLLLKHIPIHLENMPGELDFEITELELREQVKERSFQAIFEYIYTKGLKKASKSRLFLKDNSCHKQLYYLMHYYLDAKFVIQVRDPRDYVLSCKRLAHYRDIFTAIEIWKAEQEAAIEVLHTMPGDKVYILRYEDLLAEPEKVLTSLCTFINISFETGMLQFHTRSQSQIASSLSKYWRNLAKPIIKENYDKYKKELTSIEIQIIEHSLGEIMGRLGYSMSQSKTSSTARLLLLAGRSSILRFIWFIYWAIRSSRIGLLKIAITNSFGKMLPIKRRHNELKSILDEVGQIDNQINYVYSIGPQADHFD